ncbi:TfoX/Sxy family protein [Tianweitania sp. BSSL-BM11]|uniref:TfoX/Sxy family protein n=1 Tax=Tianweitania aestuarii TaxID=2814886 RepID=A0ABS5RXD5_9HYPH|nr:TfoX/Sxy family protein [Tianweitania aestuarii]MBS9720327.1 TfoX/Sxy family protein [Tianweitania aestuarii]
MDDDAIREIFDGLGNVEIRRMFGGKGIYHRGLIVGVLLHDEIMLKGDDEAGRFFEALDAQRWIYENKRSMQPVKMPYWCLPADVLDERDQLALWTRRAYESPVRIEAAKR